MQRKHSINAGCRRDLGRTGVLIGEIVPRPQRSSPARSGRKPSGISYTCILNDDRERATVVDDVGALADSDLAQDTTGCSPTTTHGSAVCILSGSVSVVEIW